MAAHLNALEQPHPQHASSSTVLELTEHPVIHNPADLRAAQDAANELLYASQDLLTLARGELERPLTMEIFSLPKVITRIAREYPDVSVDIAEAAHRQRTRRQPPPLNAVGAQFSTQCRASLTR